MQQRKPDAGKSKSQHQRFVEAARKLGTDESEEAFKRALGKIAKAPATKAKKSEE